MEILALVVIALAVIAVQSFVFRNYGLNKLEYKCYFSVNEAHEKDEIFLVEEVYNGKLLPVVWLKAELNTSRWLDFAETRSVLAQENRFVTSSFFLKSHQKVTRRWKLKCIKRGVFHIDRISLVTGDLLGNSVNSKGLYIKPGLMVYPQTIDLDKTFIPVNYLQGDITVKRWIIEDPFIVSGVREYASGDPMNKIHWNSAAHTGRLMVRREDYTSQNGVSVFLNIQSIENEYFDSVYKDYIELGIKACATIFDICLRSGIPARFACNGTTDSKTRDMIFTTEATGRGHMQSLFSILARLELRRIRDFEDFLRDTGKDIVNSEVVFITSYLNDKITGLIRTMKNRNNRVKILVTNKNIESGLVPGDIETYILREDLDINGE